jgi:inner membrane protein
MDNVTHSLTGLALARIGLHRFCPRATLLLILSANAPDIDILALTRSPLRYLELHRGFTHCLPCLPIVALLPVLVVAAIYRQKLPWLPAWFLCCIGVGSHLLIDCTNSYGVRLLLPFSSRWFHLDLNSLYDISILAVLVFAAIWPLFARLVTREIGAREPGGRATAIFALAFFVLFDCGRAILHARAVAQLQSRLWESAPPLEVAALPSPFTPLRWSGIVETAATYQTVAVNALAQLNIESAHTYYKPALTPAIESVERTEPFRYFLYFARFPVWSEQPVFMETGQGTRLDLTDLRFGVPAGGSFHCIALVMRDEVLQAWFTYGASVDLGWGGGRGPPLPVR